MKLAWAPFEVPFASPFATARGVETHRSGVLLRVTDREGLVGLGEASPLPSFHPSTLADVLAALADPSLPPPAPLQFGLETALLDLEARRAGLRVADLLGPVTNDPVAVNATVGAAEDSAAADTARRAVEEGFGCVKLKVGLAGSPPAEAARVRMVREAIGTSVLLRLDANGAWPVDEAIRTIRAVEEFAIELVEQPVGAGDLAGMARVRQSVGVPIGADEAVCTLAAAEALLLASAADVLVVKPMVLGGLRAARRVADLAPVIVTTTLEAGIGVAAALHLAATLASPARHCGVATAGLLADDLLEASVPIRGGTMALPTGPGLGVALRPGTLDWRDAPDRSRLR